MTYKDTEILIQKYLNGETTAEEERLLALEISREDVPDDWKVIAEMLGELTVDEALFDQMMAERKQKSRLVKLWPWLAAACVAALLIVFIGPPRDDVPTQPHTAKVVFKPKQVRPKVKPSEEKKVEPKVEMTATPAKRVKAPKPTAKKSVPDQQEPPAARELREVEEGDIVPYEDPMMQFAEQARTLRERGNRVIQRVSMNSIPPDNYPLNDL